MVIFHSYVSSPEGSRGTMLFELQRCLRCMDHFSKVLNTESAYVVPRGLAAPSCYAFLQLIQTISRVKPSAISVYDIPSIDVLQIQGIYYTI